MNKKINTLLFILGATLFNIAITLLSFFVLAFLYLRFIMAIMPEQGRALIFAFIFIAALAISFFVYRSALKFLIKKVEIEKYFDPIFTRKNIKKN